MREIIVGSYRVVYCVDQHGGNAEDLMITIITVIHGSRLFKI